MITNVPMYGFGGGSGTGGVLTVLAPAGHTVTISKDGKTKTKTASDDGVAVFKGLSAGAWTYVITDGTQTSQPKTADVAYETTVTASYFAATIHITYPSGSVCTATDGVTTLTDQDPDKSGNWDCLVPNTGTWTVTATNGSYTKSASVDITERNQEEHIKLNYFFAEGFGPASAWYKRYGSGGYHIGDDYLESATTGTIVSTVDNINFDCIRTLYVDADTGLANGGKINITDKSSLSVVATLDIPGTDRDIYQLDVSEVTGNYIIDIEAKANNGRLRVYNIWYGV